jgi:hypothetical protein
MMTRVLFPKHIFKLAPFLLRVAKVRGGETSTGTGPHDEAKKWLFHFKHCSTSSCFPRRKILLSHSFSFSVASLPTFKGMYYANINASWPELIEMEGSRGL